MEKETSKTEKKPLSSDKNKKQPKKNSNADFKKRYFDFYDDIKISDRQDW